MRTAPIIKVCTMELLCAQPLFQASCAAAGRQENSHAQSFCPKPNMEMKSMFCSNALQQQTKASSSHGNQARGDPETGSTIVGGASLRAALA